MGGPRVGVRVLRGAHGACRASVSWGRGLTRLSAAQGGARLAVSCAREFSRTVPSEEYVSCLLRSSFSLPGKSLFALIIINRVCKIDSQARTGP